MSLVLNVAQQPISKICIPKGVAESFLPCEEFDSSSDSPEDNSCPEVIDFPSINTFLFVQDRSPFSQ